MPASSQFDAPARRATGILPALLLGFALSPLAAAAEEIEVIKTQGDVRITSGGGERAARAGTALDLPAVLRTGRDGSADLRQGETTIGVGPDTRLDFPAPVRSAGPIGRVVQPSGSAFYDVGPRGENRLRVETPYLVAVIKGTQFNVAVEGDTSTISLFEGSLEVRSTDSDAVVQLKAGEIAMRKRGEDSIRVIAMKDRTAAASATKDSGGAGSGKDPTPIDGTVTTVKAPLTPLADDVGGVVETTKTVVPIDPVDGKVTVGVEGDISPTDTQVAIETTLDAGEAVGADAGVEVAADPGAGTIDAGAEAGVDIGGAGVDAGVDAGADLGAGAVDASLDAGADLGTVEADLGADAGADLAAGTVDAGVDASLAGADLGVDLGADLGGSDAGVDLGADLLGTEIDLGLDLGTDTTEPASEPATEESGGLLGGALGRIGL